MIRGSDIVVASSFGHTISNSFLAQEPVSESLVVLFPGGGGTCDIPLLHYARKVALQSSCDVLSLEYGYVRTVHPLSRELLPDIVRETVAAIGACDPAKYRQVYFISKSFGTLVAAEALRSLSHLPVKSLFLTPLTDTVPYLLQTHCTVVLGDRDNLFPDIAPISGQANISLHVFEGAGHSLEAKVDYKRSLEMLGEVADICRDFLNEAR